MNALIFVVDSLLQLVVYAFLLRLLLQLTRADFRNPVSQAVVKLTDWLVMPLRKVLPPVGRIDTASIVALFAVNFVKVAAVTFLTFKAMLPGLSLIVGTFKDLLLTTLGFFTFAIFIYALLSFIAAGQYNPVAAVLRTLCEPLLQPFRRVIPPLGGLDLSPVFAIIALQALRMLLA